MLGQAGINFNVRRSAHSQSACPSTLTVSGGVQDGFGGGTNVTNNLIYNQCRESGGDHTRLRTILLAALRLHPDGPAALLQTTAR